MPSLLYNLALIEYVDNICVLDRRQTVRYSNGGTAL